MRAMFLSLAAMLLPSPASAAAGAVPAIAPAAPAAPSLDPQGDYLRGLDYLHGNGARLDEVEAERWLSRAAASGLAPAARELGLLDLQRREMRAALHWLTIAAEAGDLRAMCALGTALFNGDGAPRDWPRAYAWLVRAAEAGLVEAAEQRDRIEAIVTPFDRSLGLALLAEMRRPASPVPPLALAEAKPPPPPPPLAARLPPRAPSDRPRLPPSSPPMRAATRPAIVQIGAFHSPTAARQALQLLSGQLAPADFESRIEPAAAWYRLLLRTADTAAAADLCARLTAVHWACLVRSAAR